GIRDFHVTGVQTCALPIFVFDANGELLGLWQGAASVRELRDFLQGALDAREADRQPNGALAAMLEAKRAHAKGAWLEAANHYRRSEERRVGKERRSRGCTE